MVLEILGVAYVQTRCNFIFRYKLLPFGEVARGMGLLFVSLTCRSAKLGRASVPYPFAPRLVSQIAGSQAPKHPGTCLAID